MKSGMRVKLIANPVAGKRAGERIERARTCLEARGCRVELFLTGKAGDAREAAAAAGRAGDCDRIVVAGGDGTLNEAVNGLAPSAIPLAFLPLGTANVFALEAGIPLDVEGACRVAEEGSPRPVALGRADGRRFLLMAGIGLDAEVVRRVDRDPRLKRRFGKLAYLVSGLQAFCSAPPAPLELALNDGSVHHGYGAILANARCYGGRFVVTPRASLHRPGLELCLFRQPGRLALLRCAVKIASGRPLNETEALMVTIDRATVRGKGLPVQIDGDFLGVLPMTFDASFGELQMVFPAGS